MKNTVWLLLLSFFLQKAEAQTAIRRVAYLVGNAVYDDGSHLYNPVNDVRDLAKTLRNLGFIVHKFENVNRTTFRQIIHDYGDALKNDPLSTVGLFYYSGHAIQIKGRNYLTPTDVADFEDEDDIERQCLNLDSLMIQLHAAANRMNILILDACRDNPFAFEIVVSDTDSKSAPKRKGLAAMDAPVNSFIAYSTSPDNTANDGDGLNGRYTQELIKVLQIPDLTIEQVFKKVRTQVYELSDGEQIPWESSSLQHDFYFKRSDRIQAKGLITTNTHENLPLPERYARDLCACLTGLVSVKEKIKNLPPSVSDEKRERLDDDEETAAEQSDRCLKNLKKDYIENVSATDRQKAMQHLEKICPKVYQYLKME
jgi:hypothetical protein